MSTPEKKKPQLFFGGEYRVSGIGRAIIPWMGEENGLREISAVAPSGLCGEIQVHLCQAMSGAISVFSVFSV